MTQGKPSPEAPARFRHERPPSLNGEPGETVTFEVQLVGARQRSIDDLAYHVYLWARANGRAVVKRVSIPICVGSCK